MDVVSLNLQETQGSPFHHTMEVSVTHSRPAEAPLARRICVQSYSFSSSSRRSTFPTEGEQSVCL